VAGNLVLVGFMGSGKSSVGRRVGEILDLPFVDLDQKIEEFAQMTVMEIFAQRGEEEFRRLEARAVQDALAHSGRVVALGGGAVMDERSWRLIRKGNVVVRLRATPRATLRRLEGGSGRPLAASREQLLQLLNSREPRYAEAAHQVDTTGRSVEAVAAEVARAARKGGLGNLDH
jgi:shikimate kinase